MTPEAILAHCDAASLWPADGDPAASGDVQAAYEAALAVRRLRIARGELPCGFKLGFTNRSIWPRYNVSAPIWSTIWCETLHFCDGRGTLDLNGICQPRIEPECVFGISKTPPADADFDRLFDCLEWVAPGFEVVQSHRRDWKFAATDSIADEGLHARLLVGPKIPIASVAPDADWFNVMIASTPLSLYRDGELIDGGIGANVLDGPLNALLHFLRELQACPGAPALQPGDIVTTGTWTDAWPIHAGQTWRAEFEAPLAPLEVALK